MNRLFCKIVIILILLFSQLSADIVINELMINEPGSDVALEWIELFNNDSIPASLGDYVLIESIDSTSFAGSIEIAPYDFLILSRQPITIEGEPSFEAYWGDASGTWGDHGSENFQLIQAKFSLKNSGDSVKLYNVITEKTKTIIWTSSQPDGISFERINPYKLSDDENFNICIAPQGSTPAEINSLLPPDFDIGFVLNSVTLQLPQTDSEPLIISGEIKNSGLLTSEPARLNIIFDNDFSNDVSIPDDLDSLLIPNLEPDSIYYFEKEYQQSAGRKHLILKISTDDDTTNNFQEFTFAIGDFFTELQINEFMINPDDQLDCEWVELLSVVDYDLEIYGFAIGDDQRRHFVERKYVIHPQQRLLLCEDSLNYVNYYGIPDCTIIQPTGWNNFVNSGDLILLTNDFGRISDSVRYFDTGDKNQSWERDEDSLSGTFESLYYLSADSSGSTPCEENSLRPLPPENDLGIPADGLNLILPDDTSDPVEIEIKILNYGYLPNIPSYLDIYDDLNFNAVAETEELILTEGIDQLIAGDSIIFIFQHIFSVGRHQLICQLADDQNPANNLITIQFSLGSLTKEIIITEFLADPVDDLECEWLELYNNSGRSINLNNWQVGDALRQYEIQGEYFLNAEEYLIITQDSLCFQEYYGSDCVIIQPSGWSNFNNSGDLIFLYDDLGTLSDSVAYSETAGDNRSLELNEYQFFNNDDDNLWLVSTSSSGSTPCMENSVSGEIFSDVSFSLKRQVFSPANGEQLFFNLALPPATEVTIEIFDLAGRKHNTLYNLQLLSSGEYSYQGESEYYGLLPVGAYIIKISTNNESAQSIKKGFAVAASR